MESSSTGRRKTRGDRRAKGYAPLALPPVLENENKKKKKLRVLKGGLYAYI